MTQAVQPVPAGPGAEDAWPVLLRVRDEAAARRAGLLTGRDPGGSREEGPEPAVDAVDVVDLADLYLPLCLAGPRTVVAQMGQSLDGCIATAAGDAVFVTGEEDRTHLHRLRALVDAVVVGVGTVVADDPQLTVRAVAGRNPVRVVLDPRGRAPRESSVFRDAAAPTVWMVGPQVRTGPPGPAVEVVRLGCGPDGVFPPHRVVEALVDLGYGRVLVEGGGVTVSRFVAAGVVDRLYLTVAPFLVGGGRPGVRLPGPERMRDCPRPPVRRFALGADTLYELGLTRGALAAGGRPSSRPSSSTAAGRLPRSARTP